MNALAAFVTTRLEPYVQLPIHASKEEPHVSIGECRSLWYRLSGRLVLSPLRRVTLSIAVSQTSENLLLAMCKKDYVGFSPFMTFGLLEHLSEPLRE